MKGLCRIEAPGDFGSSQDSQVVNNHGDGKSAKGRGQWDPGPKWPFMAYTWGLTLTTGFNWDDPPNITINLVERMPIILLAPNRRGDAIF